MVPGYFLNSIIKLLRLETNMEKLNQERKIFFEEGIIGNGFVRGLKPKIKTYYRFTTEFVEKLKFASREEGKVKAVY